MSFPVITIGDMVRLQKMLIDSFGIERLLSVSGGSMGGMQALEWAVAYPESRGQRHPHRHHLAPQRAADRVQRSGTPGHHGRPRLERRQLLRQAAAGRGLAVARMVGHITYMSDDSMREKFGRRLRGKENFARLRRGFRGGELPALSRQPVRRPLRRELVPLHHEGHGLFRPDAADRNAGRRAGTRRRRAFW